jgi:hypothetical protein
VRVVEGNRPLGTRSSRPARRFRARGHVPARNEARRFALSRALGSLTSWLPSRA